MASTQRFEQPMLDLARIHVEPGTAVRSALNHVARVAVRALGLGRFSVWLATEDHEAVRLYYLHRPGRDDVIDGTILRVDQFPAYFAALSSARALEVNDASTDPSVAELSEGYLKPLGVGALLDAPIYRAGMMVGIVCHEHIGGPRQWTGEEHELAADVATTVARLLEEGSRNQAEDSLRAYQKHLLELSRYEGMGRLAAGVAHDLRNLLHVVSANAEIAMEQAINPEVRASLETVLDAVKRSRELARTVLHFGHDKSEGPVVLDPAELVIDCKRLFLAALEHNQHLNVDANPGSGRVFIAKPELERVLLNLVTNAREAMPDGGTVTITVREIDRGAPESDSGRDGGELVIEVSDNGIGMSPIALAQVRRPFFSTKPHGTGLGLAMAEQILSRAGGSLEIDSVLGEGTAIRCVMPRIA